MTKSLFKGLLSGIGGKKKNKAVAETVTVDISRVIPGFISSDQDAAPLPRRNAPATQASSMETEAGAPEAEVATEYMAPEERAENAIDELSDKHDEWIQKDLAHLRENWEAALICEMDERSINELKLATHNLKGMATTYGHPSVSRLASSLSSLLDSSEPTEVTALINLHVEACRAAYIEGRSMDGGDAVANSVCAALEAQVARSVG